MPSGDTVRVRSEVLPRRNNHIGMKANAPTIQATLVFKFNGQPVYVRCFAVTEPLAWRNPRSPQVLAELLQHLKDRRQFLFRKHVDLKI
jgi:hypothetical protein